jgi:hypothetical protein
MTKISYVQFFGATDDCNRFPAAARKSVLMCFWYNARAVESFFDVDLPRGRIALEVAQRPHVAKGAT